MTEKKNINYDFKFIYAIGMILVVAGHCSNGGVSIFYDWFTPYAFHLPLFIFASGYFYKKAISIIAQSQFGTKSKSL